MKVKKTSANWRKKKSKKADSLVPRFSLRQPMNPFSKRGRLELLAPAGNLEKLKTALAFGADAVYAGIPDFSLRVRINDFNLKSLAEGIKYAHNIGKKFYVTVNILAHNKHLKKLPAHIKALKKIGPDALIVSDPGVAMEIKKIWPDVEFHLSTQANCTNWQAAKFWHEQGFKRVILGREVTIDEVKEIKKHSAGWRTKLQLETFIHGAMCMAYSGRCFLSKYLVDRSANLGDCVQVCRWKFGAKTQNSKFKIQNKFQNQNDQIFITPEGRSEEFELVEEEYGSYILNSEDLCLIKKIPEMIEAGVDSFKIEGRAKSVYYIACVVHAYRQAIDECVKRKGKGNKGAKEKVRGRNILDSLYEELETRLVHRGYTEGFMFGDGKRAQNLKNSHKKCEWEFCGSIIASRKSPPPEQGPARAGKVGSHKVLVKVHNSLCVGDEVEILAPFCAIIKIKIRKMLDAKTGESLSEAHGGQGQVIILETKKEIPAYSVIRRKLK